MNLRTLPATLRGLSLPASWRTPLAAVAIALLGLWHFAPVHQILEPSLDSSNYGSYAWFTAHEYQFGQDIVPMAGPLGFVPYGFLYAGHLFGERMLLELLTKLGLGALLFEFFKRTGPGWVRWAWLGSVLIMAPLVEDLPYDLAVLFAGLLMLDPNPRSHRRWLDFLAAALLALLSLFKGTQAQFALLVLGLAFAQSFVQKDLRRSAWWAAGYGLTLLLLLLATGQNPLNFPAFLEGVLELSSGYNNAMGIDEPLPTFLAGVGALVALLAVLGGLLLRTWRDRPTLAGTILLAAFTFVEWKHGFVRADGHVFIFFQYACVAAPTIWLFAFRLANASLSVGQRRAAAGLVWAAVLLGCWGDGSTSLGRHCYCLTQQLPDRLASTARQLARPFATKARLASQLEAHRQLYELPVLNARIGKSTIDFFGTDHGYLLLNRFRYHPRPMSGGTFNVFSPALLDRNLAFVRDPARRPHFFLVRPETIDDRFAAQDDSATLRALLGLYRPVGFEQDMVLFEDTARTDLTAPRLLDQRAVDFNEPIVPPTVTPDEVLAVEFDLPLNLLGKLRALLYKPPQLHLSLRGNGIAHPNNRRLVPALFSRPVPLSPVIENAADLVSLYTAEPGKKVTDFWLHTEHAGLFARERLTVRFFSFPRPVPSEEAAAILARTAFPVADRLPLEKQPANAVLRRFNSLLVQMLEPPGHLRFPLDGKETTVGFVFGIDPAAYQQGRTDGVMFRVELVPPGQPPQPFFHRLLKPTTRPADRPFQLAQVILPPHPAGSTLLLRTEIGPDADGAWDWGFFTKIAFRSSDFIAEQFPGFARLPCAVEAPTCGAIPYEGRELFLLNSPGQLVFELNGTETALDFQAGLLPSSYSGNNRTDGVDFQVALQEPNRPLRPIHSRRLNPREREEDRCSQSVHVPLPSVPAGTRLILTADPGPNQDTAWDWSYIESLHLQ